MLGIKLIHVGKWDHPFYYHGLTIVPALKSYYIIYKVWDEINDPFPNLNGDVVALRLQETTWILKFDLGANFFLFRLPISAWAYI